MTILRDMIAKSLMVIILSCCTSMASGSDETTNVQSVDLQSATKVELWATRYYLYEADQSDTAGAIPLRGLSNQTIGPSLSPRDWCNAAIEGSVRVNGSTFNYAGVQSPRQTSCPAHRPTERVRWKLSNFEFGIGNANNPLIPFKTIACDQGNVEGSKAWLNGGFAKFGQEIYIPSARGAELPDGSTHDGVFVCGDTGGLIVGNHIDVFLGGAAGAGDAANIDPFNFIRSSPNGTFEAFILD